MRLQFFLLALFLGPCFLLVAQKDTVGVIYVDKDSSNKEQGTTGIDLRPPPDKEDFFRHKVLIRIPVHHHQNRPLLQAKSAQPSAGTLPLSSLHTQGLTRSLLEGLRSGRLTAIHPEKPDQKYDYFDLVYNLMALEGINPEDLEDEFSLDELGWEWLNEYVDLIADKGFKSTASRPFLKIRFVRLLWYNPNSPRGLHVLAVFPYPEVESLVEELSYQLPNGGTEELQLNEFLNFRLFYGQELPLSADPASQLPPDRRGAEAIRNRWPELWRP